MLFACSSFAVTITSTPSVSTAFIGDNITYTINISNITNTNQLTTITNNLGPNLQYLGNNITSTPLGANYAIFCNNTLPTVNVNTANVLTINFPTCNTTLNGGSFSFQIYTKIKDEACSAKNHTISDTTVLNNSSTTRSIANVAVLSGIPWQLVKNYNHYTATTNELVYDVRLNAAQGGYNSQVLFNNASGTRMFSDTLFLKSCLSVLPNQCSVEWITDENNLLSAVPATNVSINYVSGLNYLVINWDLPPVSSTYNRTLNSYLFKVNVKLGNCTCPASTQFDLRNLAHFNAEDICHLPIALTDSAVIPILQCVVPTKKKCYISKKAVLDNNDLGSAMPGCTGKYIIKINNCSNYLDYKEIYFTDNAPAGINFTGTPTVIGAAGNILTNTFTQVEFYTSSVIAPGNTVIIEIPFVVAATALPDTKLINCIDVELNTENIYTNALQQTIETVCDSSIRTIPTDVTTFLEKKICNQVVHACGPFTSNNFIPGDSVIYMLHFYNYGTQPGNTLKLQDILPANFLVNNQTTDINVYRISSGSWINGTYDTTSMTNINSLVSKSYNTATRTLDINYNANQLDAFTCNGLTHYFVRIKTVIASTAPNGLYNNAFSIKYDVLGSATKTALSNVVSTVVDLNNLIISKKEVTAHHPNCDTQTDTVEYEILVGNLGQLPIMFNVKDTIKLVPGVTLIGGIQNLRYCKFTSASTACSSYLPVTANLYMSANRFVITNTLLQPCEIMSIKYKVIYNTSALPLGANNSKDVKNDAIIEAGFPENIRIRIPTQIILAHNPYLINQYFNATTDAERLVLKMEMQKENLGNKRLATDMMKIIKNFPLIPYHITRYTFTPISRDTTTVTYNVSACSNATGNGCFNSSDNNSNVSLKINGIGIDGKVSTTLNINTHKKISRIEYVLSDIRMVQTCNSYHTFLCQPCSENLTGNFQLTPSSPTLIGMLRHRPIIMSTLSDYNEKNKVEFTSAVGLPYDLFGITAHSEFQLSTNNLNCGGRLEFVITAIITYEDCSICYTSDAYKYNANYQWVLNHHTFIRR